MLRPFSRLLPVALSVCIAAVPALAQSIPPAHQAADGTSYWLIARNNQLVTINDSQVRPALVSSGFIAAKPLSSDKLFINGVLYAYTGDETQRMVKAIDSVGSLSVVSISRTVDTTSTPFNAVSFQGTDTEANLIAAWPKVLDTIQSTLSSPNFLNPTPLDPAQTLPQPYADFVKKGTFEQLDYATYRLQFARPDETKFTVGDYPATVVLGVADTIYISLISNSSAMAHAELALTSSETGPVIAYLQNNGWSVTSQAPRYTNPNNTSQPLLFLHAFKQGSVSTIYSDLYNGLSTLFTSEESQQ